MSRPGSPAVGTTPGGPLPPGVSVERVDAGGLSFRVLKGGSGPGAPTLLFLHGWPTWAEVWMPVAASLGNGFSWVAPDLPCHGETSVLPRGDVSVGRMRAAVAALADTLPGGGLVPIGCSLGGSLAAMLAVDRPDRVSAVAVLDGAGFAPKFPGRTVRMYLPFFIGASLRAPGPKPTKRLLVKAVFNDPARADSAWVDALVAQWSQKERRKALLAAGSALRRAEACVYPDLAKVACPSLFLWGAQDPQFSPAIGDVASRLAAQGQFATIEHAGHFPMVERPAETAEALRSFLGEAVARDSPS